MRAIRENFKSEFLQDYKMPNCVFKLCIFLEIIFSNVWYRIYYFLGKNMFKLYK